MDRLVYLRAITTGEVPALRFLKFLQISRYAAIPQNWKQQAASSLESFSPQHGFLHVNTSISKSFALTICLLPDVMTHTA